MDKVYVVCEEYRYDFMTDTFVGVYSTKEKAKEAFDKITKRELEKTWITDFQINSDDDAENGFCRLNDTELEAYDYENGNYSIIHIAEKEVI